jgi:dipeptidyl aminopeptidase/acylaminoacyl peptidase
MCLGNVAMVVNISAYGSWVSPISAAAAAAADGGPEWLGLHGDYVYWAERRPSEGGRSALVRVAGDGRPVDVLSSAWNVRNRVHEYGGRPWTMVATSDGDRLVFTNWADQRVYVVDPESAGEPGPISPVPERPHGFRYSDVSPGADGSSVWCVRETVTGAAPTDIRRDLVALPLSGSAAEDPAEVVTLAASHHFMSGPRVSPDGRHAAWIGWDHPAMPWDGTELCVAEVRADGSFGAHRVVAGGPREAVCQVEWDDDAHLLALVDPDGWWNLFRVGLDGSARNLAPCAAELGGPMWRLGARWFTPMGAHRYAVLRSGRLAILDGNAGSISDVEVDLSVWGAELCAADGVVVSTAGSPTRDSAVVRFDVETGKLTALTPQPAALPDPAYLPEPQERVFVGPDGRSIPAYVYPPRNPDFAAEDGELPPYVVHAHGGPTGKFTPSLNLTIAAFTSRGIGVVAVNYGGSTGYGRAFREVLNEQWGVVDVADCATVAAALAEEGSADPARLAIRGGSAGGWTAAASMTSVDIYRCATIMYPILDLVGWTSAGGETHDFESRYVESLVGRLPEHLDRYERRSPSNQVDKVTGPVLLLQGLEDEICPPEQADRFVASLDGSGIPHAYLTFPGEQHGFRRAENIIAALEAELSFYGQVFGFEPLGVPRLGLRR